MELRRRRPQLPIVYLANLGRSTPELEAQLPPDVPILREPFTADELRAKGPGCWMAAEHDRLLRASVCR